MSDVVISVENLSKKYVIGRQRESYSTLRDFFTTSAARLGASLTRPFTAIRTSANGPEEFWALKDVSFEVKRGEVIGIIGRNGAGKSTLLKILSRITEPTAGRVRIRGRVASLLEVGTGFHPELTGRENIFLNGAILGMTRLEIREKFDEIVAFAEVEQFLDTPVKRYSSGMYIRLAFAVAAHLEPEILLVDEVLAVGDAAFQNKCIGKMDSVACEGRTVFLVSHNMGSVKRLCGTVLLLSEGEVKDRGRPDPVISAYLESSLSGKRCAVLPEESHLVKSFFRIKSIQVLNSGLRPTGAVMLGESISVMLLVEAQESASQVRVGIGLCCEGRRLSTVHSPPLDFLESGQTETLVCRIESDSLLPNFYTLHVGAFSSVTGQPLDWVPDAIGFSITPVPAEGASEFEQTDFGMFRLAATWELDGVEAGTVVEPGDASQWSLPS